MVVLHTSSTATSPLPARLPLARHRLALVGVHQALIVCCVELRSWLQCLVVTLLHTLQVPIALQMHLTLLLEPRAASINVVHDMVQIFYAVDCTKIEQPSS